jgi:hypothetical protein
MPYRMPKRRTQQAQYNAQLQQKFAATHRVQPQPPASTSRDPVATLTQLAELHEAGVLNDAELAAAKERVLGGSKAQ